MHTSKMRLTDEDSVDDLETTRERNACVMTVACLILLCSTA